MPSHTNSILRFKRLTSTEREAMWIKFTATKPFAVKVYVGGVNAISGESKVVTDATKQRRKEVRCNWNFFKFNFCSLQNVKLVPNQSSVLGSVGNITNLLFTAIVTKEIHSGLCCTSCATLARWNCKDRWESPTIRCSSIWQWIQVGFPMSQ